MQKQCYPWGVSGKQSLFCELGAAFGFWKSAPLLKDRFFFFLLDGFASVPQNSLPSNSQCESEARVICLGLREEKALYSVMIPLFCAFHHKGTDALNIASIWVTFLLWQSCSCTSGSAGLCCWSFYTGGKIKSQQSLLAQVCGIIVFLVVWAFNFERDYRVPPLFSV